MADNIPQRSEEEIARVNMARYQYSMSTGHRAYMETAIRNEDMYLGGGLQWTEADRNARAGQPMIELNHILPAVNTATGMQLHSRVDMNFLPRGGGADEQSAIIMTKVVRQICDDINYQWSESQVYEDGLIQQRGYMDFRIDFTKNIFGDIVLDILDPLDVKPDPDARSYDPKDWADVLIDRWLTRDQIEERYGKDVADRAESQANAYYDEGDTFLGRPHFNDDSDGTSWDGWVTQEDDDKSTRLYLVIDRQHKHLRRGKVFAAWTGETTPVEMMSEEDKLRSEGQGVIATMNFWRIRWTVTCGSIVCHDDWSPYRSYTMIPYFPYFRRGRTRGMVDNLVSPQELENKSITNYLEILGSSSNSGWDVPENSLVNMEPEDLEAHGAKNGLVLVYRTDKSGNRPTKRQPSNTPVGADKLIDRAEFAIKTISGMSDALQGQKGNEVSGVAIESKQYVGYTQMGRPLDNLAFTRRLAAKKTVELIQQFYTNERVIRIIDRETMKTEEELVINEVTLDGILNDVTIGIYDVVISDTPTHASYQQGQFAEVMEMKKEGVQISDKHIIGASSYSKKHELIQEIEEAEKSAGTDPLVEAEVAERQANTELKKAQAEKARAEKVSISVESKYSAVQTAGVISLNPSTAPLADVLLRSSGDVDEDQPPLLPAYPQDAQQVYRQEGQRPIDFPGGNTGLPENTNPLTPLPPPDPSELSPRVGMKQGIETQEID